MHNTNIGILTALFIALSTGLAEARVAGVSQPVSLWSGDTTPPQQEWSSLRPAAKAVAQASNCSSVDVAALTGDALTNYLRTTSKGCLERTLRIASNPSIRADLPTIFSNRNMQSVFAEIEELAVGYDGTNRSGMLQLWVFAQVGYDYHRFFPGESGVRPFDAATDHAYLTASDAFAASDHFYAPNDEAAQILYYYFETAFAAGLRRNHLAPIKRVLSGFTPERAASGDQAWSFETVLHRVRGAFQNNNQVFRAALAQDPEFVEVMLQVTRYDFFFLIEEDHPFTPRLQLLEKAVDILVRLMQLDSLREAAISALTSVLAHHERLSSPFLVAAQGLENQISCASLNICRDVLEREILAQALPNTYRFDDGAIVFQTPLDLAEVRLWYYAAKEVQAQFHRLVETDEVVRADLAVFTARIYGTRLDYTLFEAYLSGKDTRGIHSSGGYGGGTMTTFVRNRPGDLTRDSSGPFEETFRHEYAHYLADRFGLNGGPWFDEGLAEFLVGSTQAEGTLVRDRQIQYIAGNESRLAPAGLFNSKYSGGFGGGHFYYYADLFFHFMHQQRRTPLLELFDLLRSGDHAAYNTRIATWAADNQLAADFDAFLDEQIAKVSREPGSNSPFTYVPQTTGLTSNSPAEIESALQRINSTLGLRCQTVATESNPRFGCAGNLPAGSESSGEQGEPDLFDLSDLFANQSTPLGENGDRGALNEHLNTRLDSFIVAAIADGALTNFNAMNCYFANVAGSPPVADLYCEGPLRPADVDWVPPQVDLQVTLTDLSGGSSIHVGNRLRLAAALDFREEAASNVTFTWSASLPVTNVLVRSSVRCEVVEETERKGTLTCGTVYNQNVGWPLTLELYFTPLQAGSLDLSIEFSADEPETDPSDNVASVQWTIARMSPHIATLSSWARSVAFSPDGTTLAAGTADGMIQLWDIATKTKTATLESSDYVVSEVAFSPDGTTLAAGMGDGTVTLWKVATETKTATLVAGDGAAYSVAFSPDGTTLATGMGDGTVTLWKVATKTKIATFPKHGEYIQSVAFSPDGITLAVGALDNDNTVKLWNVATETNIANLSGHNHYLTSVAFSPDGTILASGSADDTARLWDVSTKTHLATLKAYSAVGAVAFSPDGTTLAAGVAEKGVELWDVATKTHLASLSGHSRWVHSVAFSPDGTTLASASSEVKLWDVSEWKRAKRLARAEERSGLPDGPQLQQNAPNPFNSETVLSYFLHAPGPARLEVFALTGQRVAVLHQGPQQAGYHRLHWDARDDAGRSVASGMYLYRLVTNEGALTRKLMLLR